MITGGDCPCCESQDALLCAECGLCKGYCCTCSDDFDADELGIDPEEAYDHA